MKPVSHTLVLATLLAAAAVPSASKLATAPLDVLLSLTDDLTNIKANVTNLGVEAIDVIQIHTPLSSKDLGGYRISYQNSSKKTNVVPYQGFINTYVTANLSEFHRTIGPKMTVTTLLPLSLFDFGNSSGPYSLSTSGLFQYRLTNADSDSEYMFGKYESNVVQFSDAPAITQPSRAGNFTERVFTEACTQAKGDAINQSGLDYGLLVDAAVKALTGSEDTAFKEFFGTASNTRYRTITSRFYNLQGAKQYANTQEQQPPTFEFSCSDAWNNCNGGVAAYVHAPEQNVVTLCALFFGSRMHRLSDMCTYTGYVPSNDGIAYSGAILLHEFMHLEAVMKQQPIPDQYNSAGNKVYGYTLSKALASQEPGLAAKNPDNYKYFAEVEYARTRGGYCSKIES